MQYMMTQLMLLLPILVGAFFYFFLTTKEWDKSKKSFKIITSIVGIIVFIFTILSLFNPVIDDSGYFLSIFVLGIVLPSFFIVYMAWLIRWIVIKKTK